MAKRSIPNRSEHLPNLDRRRLLASAALATTASIRAAMNPAETTLAEMPQPLPPPPLEIPTLNVSAATTRRLLEIERRNELRREADLPLLSIAKEIRRMKERDDSQKFSEAFGSFVAQHSKAVWDEVLKPRRDAVGDDNWKPRCWSEGIGYQSEVYRILRERFEAEQKSSWVASFVQFFCFIAVVVATAMAYKDKFPSIKASAQS